MPTFQFVNDFSSENLKSHQIRTHAAKVSYDRRKQKVKSTFEHYVPESVQQPCTTSTSTPIEYEFSILPKSKRKPFVTTTKKPPNSLSIGRHNSGTERLSSIRDLQAQEDNSEDNEACSTTILPTVWVQPALSSYLNETYQASSAREVSSLWDYLLSYYGPIFIWVPFDSEDERTSFRTFIISGWLNDPSQCEAVLALAELIRINDSSTSRKIKISRAVLQHQGRALSLLRKKLSGKDAAMDRLALWTIYCILMIQFELGDWRSYTINLFGLRQIIALHGGADALAVKDPRSAAFARQLEGVYTNHLISLRPKQADPTSVTTAAESPESLREQSSYAAWSLQWSLSQLPEGLSHFYIFGQLHGNVAETLSQCVHYLHRSEHIKDDPTLPDDGKYLRFRLFAAMRTFGPRTVDYVLSIGMLILCMSGQRKPTLDNEQWHGEQQQLEDLAVALNRTWAAISPDSPEMALKTRDCLLWTALIFATMPSRFMPIYAERHFLRRHLLSGYHEDRSWQSVRSVFAGFYINPSLAERWRLCLERTIQQCGRST